MIRLLPARSEWEYAWQQGRWSSDLCDAAWKQADDQPGTRNLHLALNVQHALCGLQTHHLDYTQQLVAQLSDPWQATTLRLMCARLQLGHRDAARAILDDLLAGPITLRRSHLLKGFPLALDFIQAQQPQRLPARLNLLAEKAHRLHRSCPAISRSSVMPLADSLSNSCRVAVVGNARCLLDRDDGIYIDEHDIVVRFNAASVDEKYSKQVGRRTDLWVISPALPQRHRSLPARALAVSGINPFAGQSRYWQSLHKRGIPLLMRFAQQHWYALVQELAAPPSAGLLMLRSLMHDPSGLEVNAFGFSRPEHLERQSAGAHYSDSQSGSPRHNWNAEAQWVARTVSDLI